MITRFFLAIFLVIISSFGQKNSDNTTLKNKLLSIGEDVTYREVFSLLKQIDASDLKNKKEIYKEFFVKNKRYGPYAIRYLYQPEYAEFINWLEKNLSNINNHSWEEIANQSTHIGRIKEVEKVWSLLKNALLDTLEGDTKSKILYAFQHFSVKKESGYFRDLLKTEINMSCRGRILVILSRFKEKTNDDLIKRKIIAWKEIRPVEKCIEYGIKKYNRYDFLPTLYALQKKLKNEKDVAKVEDAKETLRLLDTVIPHLEKKKAEKAPIGLPPNWPEG